MANVKTIRHEFLQMRFLLDAVMIALALLSAYFMRFVVFHYTILPVTQNYESVFYAQLFLAALPLTMLAFGLCGLYGLRDPVFNMSIFRRIVRGAFLGLALVLTLLFILKRTTDFSRPVLIMAPFLVVLFATCGRLALRRQITDRVVHKKSGVMRVLIVGIGPMAQNLAQKIRQHPESGLEIQGFVAAKPEQAAESIDGLPVLGGIGRIRDLIRDHKVREVIFAQPDMSSSEIFDLMVECEKEICESRFVPNLLEMRLTDYSFENVGGLPLYGLKETPLQGMNLVIKTLFDKVVSSLLLVVGSPVYAALTAWILYDSGQPIFYKQRRLAMDGRMFNMYKFRSMYLDAENPGEARWTEENDPRCTKAGRFMRRWNLDELPQLINVWRGDMSLVGPRPERPEWVEKFREEIPHYMRRHTVKSGMTGWAQVNGLRGDTDLCQRLEFDLYYIENWTLWLDIKILLMTFRARKNAY